MKKIAFVTGFLLTMGLASSAALPGLAQSANESTFSQLCTRSPGGRVNLRTGPGTNYARGFVQVGAVPPGFFEPVRRQNYSLLTTDPLAEYMMVFEVTRNNAGESWSKVGTNLWVAWVRSDFVCAMRQKR